MERKMLTRYLILIIALTIFAGAAWYFTQDSGSPQAGAVLARMETRTQERQLTEMQLWMPEMRLAEMQLQVPEVQPEGVRLPLGEEVSHEL